MEELISVIIPVYNVEHYLERCLNSVVNQTYKKLEIILVDDGSTDSSGCLCDEWEKKDDRIVVLHQDNAGASVARNKGLQYAKGAYLTFIDSDDWVEVDMLEYFLKQIVFQDADMVISDVYLCKKEKLEVWNQKRYLEYFFRTRGEGDTHSVCGRLYKKEMLDDFCFLEGRMNEDVLATYEFAIRCKKAIYTSKTFYHYEKNVEGVTLSPITRKKMDLLYVWDLVYEKVKNQVPDYMEYCEMNVLRARFTLLCQMIRNGIDKSDQELIEKKKEMKKELKKGYWKLMRWKMPVSRKILLCLIVNNFIDLN